MERHADLLVAAGAIERDGRGPYALYATHLAILLAEAAPALDAPLTARSLLATLGPGHYLHARRALGWEVERLKRAGPRCARPSRLAGPEADDHARLALEARDPVARAGRHDRLLAGAEQAHGAVDR